MGLIQYDHYYDCGSQIRIRYPEDMYQLFKAGWNTRGQEDSQICRYPGYIEDQEQYYGNLMAEAIEKIDVK